MSSFAGFVFVQSCRLFACDFFFFKQKTAYEMRISDWSSDVCSSDLDDGLDRRLIDDRLLPGAEPGGADDVDHLGLGGQRGVAAGRRRCRKIDQIGRASCRERVCQYV